MGKKRLNPAAGIKDT